jgi:hypothetical protein
LKSKPDFPEQIKLISNVPNLKHYLVTKEREGRRDFVEVVIVHMRWASMNQELVGSGSLSRIEFVMVSFVFPFRHYHNLSFRLPRDE